jgi:hypothetical protein
VAVGKNKLVHFIVVAILHEHVDHLNTIREFINMFEADVQKIELTSFSLGLVIR